MQQLLTDEQMEKLKQIGLSEEENENQVPFVRLHIPGKEAYWLFSCIVSGTEQMAYGIFEFGLGSPELGYFDLSEIAELKSIAGWPISTSKTISPNFCIVKISDCSTKGMICRKHYSIWTFWMVHLLAPLSVLQESAKNIGESQAI